MGVHTVFLVLALLSCLAWGQLDSPGAHPHAMLVLHIAVGLAGLGALFCWKPGRRDFIIILLVGITCRAALFPIEPSDDLHRYISEGLAQAAGVNPYLTPPAEGAGTFLPEGLAAKVNHPEITAIYPPGMLLVFRVMSQVSTNPAWFKAVVLLMDLATLVLLLRMLSQIGRQQRWALLYAVNPVVLMSFAGEAHLDAFMLFPLVLSLFLFNRKQYAWMFIALSLAVQAKYAAVVMLPFLVTPGSWKRVPWLLPGLLLPFAAFPPYQGFFEAFRLFTSDMHFNGPIFEPLLSQLDDLKQTSRLTTEGLLICLVLLRLCIAQPMASATWVFFAVCLFSNNTHSWYLTWFIPFLCLRPSASGLLWCLGISLTYLTYGHQFHTGEWVQADWTLQVQALLLFAGLVWDLCRSPKTLYDATPRKPVRTLSILIPVLNEKAALSSLLEQLKGQVPAPEIIVADGGSNDGSLELARASGCKVVQATRGRGSQLAAGTNVMEGDALLVLHADCRPLPDTVSTIINALNQSGKAGGALGCRFDAKGLPLRIIEILNHLRAQWGGISFGDQGQFIRRDVLEETGGFPDQPLMEDVECSIRLKNLEPPLYLHQPLTVSARSWQQAPASGRAWLIIRLVARYLVDRFFHQQVDTEGYYQKYYTHTSEPPIVES